MIVKAAIQKNGLIYTGRRHSEIIKDMIENHGIDKPIGIDEQGFVDEDGRFYTRSVAAAVAVDCGQIPVTFNKVLTSEDLW